MDPSSNEKFGMQLPTPVEAAPAGAAEAAPAGPETTGTKSEGANSGGGAAQPITVPLPTSIPAPTATPIPVTTTQVDSGLSADDNDLIEKEWVNKAKAIIDRTRDDPYKQSEALTLVKADYMQKRYNKSIKVSGK